MKNHSLCMIRFDRMKRVGAGSKEEEEERGKEENDNAD